MAFAARFRGHCSECPEVIIPGEQVVATPDGYGHVRCFAEAERPSARSLVKICSICNLTLPCACE